jgi:hypothetical protein
MINIEVFIMAVTVFIGRIKIEERFQFLANAFKL